MGLRGCGGLVGLHSSCTGLVERQLDLPSVAARLRGSFPTEPVTREAQPLLFQVRESRRPHTRHLVLSRIVAEGLHHRQCNLLFFCTPRGMPQMRLHSSGRARARWRRRGGSCGPRSQQWSSPSQCTSPLGPSGSPDLWAVTVKIGSSAWAEGRVLGVVTLRVAIESAAAECATRADSIAATLEVTGGNLAPCDPTGHTGNTCQQKNIGLAAVAA
ncbi:hypothetical protein Taro_044092 [Colocasia esculenta]|uniref:Uncharacterized protein n=1 Tax=Colocasia esculenta TaxID=4460 RepID=A0A843WMT6_COLES|nr:hypothetical protein [Colocasia esculenta]